MKKETRETKARKSKQKDEKRFSWVIRATDRRVRPRFVGNCAK